MLLRAPSSTSSARFHHALWYHRPLVFAARLGWVLERWLMPRWSRSEQAAKRLAGDLPGLSERQQAEHVGVARTTVAVLASTPSRDSGACGGGGIFRDGRRDSVVTAVAHRCPFCDNAPGVWRCAPGLPVFGTDGFGNLYRGFLWRTTGRQCRAGTGGGALR